MSTPFPPNNKRRGIAIYAPPRVRERTFSQDHAETADTSGQTETTQPDAEETDWSEAPAPERKSPANDAGGAKDALDWLDDAIREVVELKLASHSQEDCQEGCQEDSDPSASAPSSPSIMPGCVENDDWPTPGARAHDRAESRNSRPRPPGLDTQILPPPPAAMHESIRLGHWLRIIMVVVFAAVVAFGVTLLYRPGPSAPPSKEPSRRAAAAPPRQVAVQLLPQTPPHLMVEDQQAFANQPLSLAVNIAHAVSDDSLLFDGLASGTTLSAGAAASRSSWRLSPDKLRGLYLYAPKDFVGVMNTTVNLLGPDKKLLDSRDMRLKWISKPQQPQPPQPVVASAGNEMPAIVRRSAAVVPVAPAVRSIDPGEAALLMQRGLEFLGAGDISAARVAFRRLANAGRPDAALALANSYDPAYLTAHNFVGVQGDRAMARHLYQRAKELGSAAAARILADMAH